LIANGSIFWYNKSSKNKKTPNQIPMNTKKFIKQALIVLGLMAGAIAVFSMIPVASAALISPSDVPSEVSAATGGEGSIKSLVLRIVNYALTFLGIVAVMIIIFAGFTYVTAAGAQDKVDNAKKMIMYALIGIVIILLSFAIVNTVLQVGTGGSAATTVQ